MKAEIRQSQELNKTGKRKNGKAKLLLRYRRVNVSLLFLKIYISLINVCGILFNRSRNITILRILGKTQLQHPPASYTRTNYINAIS